MNSNNGPLANVLSAFATLQQQLAAAGVLPGVQQVSQSVSAATPLVQTLATPNAPLLPLQQSPAFATVPQATAVVTATTRENAFSFIPPSYPPRSTRVIREQRRLFNRGGTASRVPNASSRVSQWTREFCCVASVGISSTKDLDFSKLYLCGLGKQRITFPKAANADEVEEILYSTFPRLKDGEGVRLLKRKQGSRFDLELLADGCRPVAMMDSWTTRGTIFVCPLQKSLSEEPLPERLAFRKMRQCTYCSEELYEDQISDHIASVHQKDDSDDDELRRFQEFENSASGNDFEPLRERTSTPDANTSMPVLSANVSLAAATEVSVVDLAPMTPNERRDHISKSENDVVELQKLILSDKVERFTEDDEKFCIVVRLQSAHVVQDGLTELTRSDYDPTKVLTVETIGRDGYAEVGVDRGGPRREFLQSFLENFSGELVHKDGPNRGKLIVSEGSEGTVQKFVVLGKAIASGLIHDGIMPHFLSADTLCHVVSSPRNVEETALAEGLDIGLAREFLKEHPSLLARCTFKEPVTTTYVLSLLPKATQCVSGTEGSRLYNMQSSAYMFMRKFVTSLPAESTRPDDSANGATLEMLLGWLTGCKTRRVFNPVFTIEWKEPFHEHFASQPEEIRRKNRIFPRVSTCGFVLELPLDCVTYTDFEERFLLSLLEGYEFGSA